MLRRMAGSPIKGEGYITADIVIGRVGSAAGRAPPRIRLRAVSPAETPSSKMKIVIPAALGAAATRIAPLATTETVTAPPQLPHHKVKIKKLGQRSCNKKDAKGKFCGGHFKRWFYTTDVVEQTCGDAERPGDRTPKSIVASIARLSICRTRRACCGLNVAGQGQTSVFGLTVVLKNKPTPVSRL